MRGVGAVTEYHTHGSPTTAVMTGATEVERGRFPSETLYTHGPTLAIMKVFTGVYQAVTPVTLTSISIPLPSLDIGMTPTTSPGWTEIET